VKVLVSEVARTDVRRIGQAEAIRTLRSISEFAKTGHGDVRVLTGAPAGNLRLRVGDYRVIYVLRDDLLLVVVIDIGHRRDVYRNV